MARILQIHNRYLTSAGGEDTMVAEEFKLLQAHGHEVHQMLVSASAEDVGSKAQLLKTALNNAWSFSGPKMVRQKLEEVKPDIVHVHNTFPVLSPSIFWELRKHPVRTVVTFHNYRTICAGGKLMRDNRPCEICVGKGPWQGVKHACYKGSKLGSAARALNIAVHQSLHTYEKCVDAILVPTEFVRQVFIRAGLPAELVHAKYNFVGTVDPFPDDFAEREKRLCFVGRVDSPKGVDRLLAAWDKVDHQGHVLEIIGDGPIREGLQERFANVPNVLWSGWMQREQVRERIRSAKFVVMASTWYETFGMVLAEAFTCGTPVIAPNLGAMAEVAGHGEAGLLFDNDDPEDITRILNQALAMPAEKRGQLARAGWDSVNTRYSPEANYLQLAKIYGIETAAQEAPELVVAG